MSFVSRREDKECFNHTSVVIDDLFEKLNKTICGNVHITVSHGPWVDVLSTKVVCQMGAESLNQCTQAETYYCSSHILTVLSKQRKIISKELHSLILRVLREERIV